MREAAGTLTAVATGSHPIGEELHPAPDAEAPVRDRRWLVLIAMTGALSMILIDDTVVSVALPTIQRDLHMSSTALQWIMNAYLLTIGAFIAVAGKVSDVLGRKKVFILGVFVFIICSALSGLSHYAESSTMLIAARTFQGIGAAMMIPSSQAIVTSAFPLKQRGTAMGIYAGVSMAFLAMGPLIGGLLTENFGWWWVFFVNLPLGIVTVIMTFVANPEEGRLPGHQRFDFLGAILLVPGLSFAVVALMQSTTWGWGSPLTIGMLVAGLVLLVVFARVEWTRESPLIELHIMKYGNFATDTSVLFLVQFALMGMSIFGAIYAQDVLGFSPITAGAAALPLTIPILFVAPPVGRLYDRLGPRPLVSLGAGLMTASILYSAFAVLKLDYVWLIPGYVITGIGIALIMTPANTDAMNSAPAALRGQASGVIQTFRQVGGTVGIAVLSTIILNTSNAKTTENLQSAGFTAEQSVQIEGLVQQVQQGGTAGTPAEAGNIPPAIVEKVQTAFDDGFASALSLGYVIVSILLFLATMLAITRLRKIVFAEDGGVQDPSG